MKLITIIQKAVFFFAVFSFLSFFSYGQTTIISYGSSWKYWANNLANFPTGWQSSAFDDSAWPAGNGELGYGDGDEATCVPAGGGGTLCLPSGNKYATTYFRKTISIGNPLLFTNFSCNVERDDGYVVYVNGTEVGRDNLPAFPAAISYGTSASAAIEDGVTSFTIPNTAFVAGDNVIAVEIHQASVSGSPPTSTSSDISFNLQLTGNDAFSATLTRGPYLQMGSQTAITVRWRTATSQNSRIEIGTSFGSYPTVITDAANVTEHIVSITGLSPDTKYYYRIGNSTNMGAPDADKFFKTVPPTTTTGKVRIIAFGDCGRGNIAYQDENLANYRNFLTTNGIDAADAWILLGDNAYNSGTDAEYTTNFFDIYGDNLLKNHKLYPSPGNHDYGNNTGNKSSRAMPYYNCFTVPQAGECGGVASNKPNFYSFDIGNIHFLSLDSWGIETDLTHMGTSGSTMLKTWIDADLAGNTQKWTVAYWHHAPYTKGSHDSDAESELAAIRQNFITYLESRGVDMILCGHSHGYERGYLLKNYTGSWSSFNAGIHAVSTSSATYTSNSTCPYVYNSTPLNHGTVYVVSGSAGASGTNTASFGTNAMPYALNDGGVFYFETENNRLDAKMLRRDGTIFDRFTILKDVNKSVTQNIVTGNTAVLTASWPGNYSWSNTATTRSINFTPLVSGTTNFTVTDDYGCMTDQFTVNATGLLPVDLLSFDVRLNRTKKVDIQWSTATESGSDHFNIERSVNGNDYTALARISGSGNSTSIQRYSFIDDSPLPGISFYRLSQKDQNDNTAYLGVKKIVNNYTDDFEVKTLSVGNNRLIIEISTKKQANCYLRVHDIAGREKLKERISLMSGITRKEITLTTGAYIWEVREENGTIHFQKVVMY